MSLSASCGSERSGESGEYNLIDRIGPEDAGPGSDAALPDAGQPDGRGPQQPDATLVDAIDPREPWEQLGEPCDGPTQCDLGRCLQDNGFVEGYCTTPNTCEFDDHCPEGTACAADAGGICARRCERNADCRDGYTCQGSPVSPFDVCLPPPAAPTAAPDGAACTRNADCAGGYCLEEPDWPGGYCTTLRCQTFEDCARESADGPLDNRCLVQDGATNLCVRMCRSDQECRSGYLCQPISAAQGFCAPDPAANVNLDNLDDYPFPITCGISPTDGRVTIDYDIAPTTTSYLITPLALDGQRLMPTRIQLPNSSNISFRGSNNFQTATAMLFGFLNPILTPAIEEFASQLQAGRHTLELTTSSDEICYYLLEESSPGTKIDLNIYLVGMGKTAAQASVDPDMQAVVAQFGAIYSQAGIEVGAVRFQDVTGSDARAYQILRSESDLSELVSLSQLPAGGYTEALSVNVFFVRSMQLDGVGDAIGVSQGLPGAAGLHGTPSSGVVFTSEYIGQLFQDYDGAIIDGNEFTGLIMAHEVGHYLGLFHTSEQYGQGFDPIRDTPECRSRRDFPDNCPDINNLMFPLAGISHTQVSAGQAHVIKANPLTKD